MLTALLTQSTILKNRLHTSKIKTTILKRNFTKIITTILKSFDTIGIIATTLSSFTLSLTGIGLKAIPLSTATACGLSMGNKQYTR